MSKEMADDEEHREYIAKKMKKFRKIVGFNLDNNFEVSLLINKNLEKLLLHKR